MSSFFLAKNFEVSSGESSTRLKGVTADEELAGSAIVTESDVVFSKDSVLIFSFLQAVNATNIPKLNMIFFILFLLFLNSYTLWKIFYPKQNNLHFTG